MTGSGAYGYGARPEAGLLAAILVDGKQQMPDKETARTRDMAGLVGEELVLDGEIPHTLDLKVTKEGTLFDKIFQLVLFNGLLMLN